MNKAKKFLENQAMYLQQSQVASQGHEDYLSSLASPTGSSNIHINPNFNKPKSSRSIHINPNFKGNVSSSSVTPKVHINPNFQGRDPKLPTNVHVNPKAMQVTPKVHVNPNFAGTPLPPVPTESQAPHVNPNAFKISPTKKKEYTQAVEASVDKAKVFINPKFDKKVYSEPSSTSIKKRSVTNVNVSPSEKENTPLPKSVEEKTSTFKKIGQRKLIRIQQRSSSTTETTPAFKKIGTRKLIRMKSNSAKKSSPKTSPALVYKVKTSRKIIKTPTSTKKHLFSRFMTPLSARRRHSPRSGGSGKMMSGRRRTPFSHVRNPFKIDRRAKPSPKKPSPIAQPSPPLTKTPAPPKPARSTTASKQITLLTADGSKFAVSENGRTLKRLEGAGVHVVPKKLFFAGEEYVEDEQSGTLIRSRNSMTRQSITSYRNRSINTIIKSQTRSKQYCMFYNKFGKCNKKDKGVCPYIHDQDKVAVCRGFLLGNCHNEKCLLSHKAAPDKMPPCKFFLEGLCTKDNCPYRHVNVNPTAPICPEYLKGYCSKGDECKLRHLFLCPEFEKSGQCPKGQKCPLPHKTNEPKTPKKVAPVKPKRKSLGNTPMVAQEQKKARLRYYEEQKPAAAPEKPEDAVELSQGNEEKRKRLLRKVELAKQGWTGMAVTDPNDSGPYEEIDESVPQSREPVGQLPAFIPLGQSSDEEEEFEERLI